MHIGFEQPPDEEECYEGQQEMGEPLAWRVRSAEVKHCEMLALFFEEICAEESARVARWIAVWMELRGRGVAGIRRFGPRFARIPARRSEIWHPAKDRALGARVFDAWW